MRKTTTTRLLAAALLAATTTGLTVLVAPHETTAFSKIGGSLDLDQRDFRVFNNFSDAGANNNTTPHPNFPGALGAVMSVWKGHAEWASSLYAGDGQGDPTAGNSLLGQGEANFDNTYQGEAFEVGTTNDNIHSEINQTNNGALAFAETPISDGWRIRYYVAPWNWKDGPGSESGSDIQGVATHEIGHSFGLGHETGCSTMNGCFGNCLAQRSICNDDQLGIQCIYGTVAAGKPQITGLSGSQTIGETLVIDGSGFDTAGDNEVWFTKVFSDGVPIKVTNVPATGGGTQISVTVPNGVQDGEVLVKDGGSGNAALSNAFPIDVETGDDNPPFLASIEPTIGQAGGFEEVTLSGLAFTGTTSVTFGGTPVLSFTVDSDTQITVTTPGGDLGSIVDVTVTNPDGSSTLSDAYEHSFNNPPDIDTVTPDTGPEVGGTVVTVTGPSVVGAVKVEFGGVEGTGLIVNSATELQVTTPPGPVGDVDVKLTIDDGVIFFETDTIADGFTYTAGGGGAFVPFGTGSPGLVGIPDLDGAGDLTPGSGTGFTIDLTNAAPLAPVTLFVSAVSASVPFKGQTLYTFPILVQIPLGNTTAAGTLSLPGAIPASTPGGVSVFLQMFITDGAGIQGLASTNGLELQIP